MYARKQRLLLCVLCGLTVQLWPARTPPRPPPQPRQSVWPPASGFGGRGRASLSIVHCPLSSDVFCDVSVAHGHTCYCVKCSAYAQHKHNVLPTCPRIIYYVLSREQRILQTLQVTFKDTEHWHNTVTNYARAEHTHMYNMHVLRKSQIKN